MTRRSLLSQLREPHRLLHLYYISGLRPDAAVVIYRPMGKISVGSDVEAYCTKCKIVLAHTVVAMGATKPRRVKCNTCDGEHNYRASKPAAKTPAKKGERKTRATTRKTRQSWEEVMKEAESKPHKKYSMSGSFGEGDWIEHATFGLGCVQSFIAPNKITVRFADSTKLLVCNRS
jgi:hypothetical protein